MLYVLFFVLGGIAHLSALWAERDNHPLVQLMFESMTIPILILFLVGSGIWVPDLFDFFFGAEIGRKTILAFFIFTLVLLLGVCWRLLMNFGTLHMEMTALQKENEDYKKIESARRNNTPRTDLKKND